MDFNFNSFGDVNCPLEIWRLVLTQGLSLDQLHDDKGSLVLITG